MLAGVTTKREARRRAANRDPATVAGRFSRLAQLYRELGCPDGKLKPRRADFTGEEVPRVIMLEKFFGDYPLDRLNNSLIPEYHRWRLTQITTGRRRARPDAGARTTDKDTQTLSNVFRYAVSAGLYPHNPFAAHRPRYQVAEHVSHTKDRAPASATIIHAAAEELFSRVSTEVSAWVSLFGMFSGCRISELLRLRHDAANRNYPGYRQWATAPKPGRPVGLLHLGEKRNGGGRAKNGLNPEIIIGAEFADLLRCYDRWHAERYPNNPWYFPNFRGNAPILRRQVAYHVAQACAARQLPHFSPHGLRGFYVTKRRSDGASDTMIAGELGDQTVALMQTTYGRRPDDWLDGEAMSWLPAEGLPAWRQWAAAESKVVKVF